MNLDLSVASLVRASSGALMVGFGLYLLTLRPGTLRSRALGAYHVALGPVFIGTNLLRWDLGALALWFRVTVPLFVVASGALVVFAWSASRGHALARRVFVLSFGACLAVNLAVALLVPSDIASGWAASGTTPEVRASLSRAYDEGRPFYSALEAAASAAVIAFAVLFRATADATERRRLAVLAAGISIYPVFDQAASLLLDAGSRATAVVNVLAFAFAAFAWALVARGLASAAARNAALAVVISGLVGMGTAVLGDDYGLIGVARLAGITLLAYAVFRLDLLGTAFQARTIRRGSVATAGLGTLFIVAQVAQEFFAAEYGLLMGGVVAGTLLFAANPVQRAMERMAGHERVQVDAPDAPAPGGRSDAAERERAYREAVRLALRDRTLAREEERHLLRLAYHLGVPTPRAMEIHDEMEREEVAP